MQKVDIKNKKALFEYEILEKFTAGLQLMGSEVKSIRAGKASIGEAYCFLQRGEIWIKNMNVSPYKQAAAYGHDAVRVRKLLLNKREIDKIEKKLKVKGNALIPLKMFNSERGMLKLEIAIGRGKKLHDKRNSIKDRESKRSLDRIKKMR